MDALLDPQPQLQPQLRYDGEERRLSRGDYPGAERRAIDPPTEQDYPEEFEPH
jgi:hypothetical protein